VGKPPQEPYEPDLPDEYAPQRELATLVDAIVQDVDAANLRNPHLDLRRVVVRGCRLTGAELAESTFVDVAFEDCRLDLAALRFAQLERVVFRDCRMNECDLYDAVLKDVLLERCDLREATLTGMKAERVELRACALAGARGADALRGARMPWNDVIENAAVFATALGIEIVD
jgi:uncharacterized protein YjbI with pentapeptide repeats